MLKVIDLSGVWDFSLAQMQPGSIPPAFSDTISLPGTTSLAKKGTPNDKRETGCLTDAYAFEGQAWYRKTVYIDPAYWDMPIQLVLERTRLTSVWVDGTYLGAQDSLCTPHIYDLSGHIHRPDITLTILVQNTGYPTKGGHLTSPDTQSNWNGITGDLRLEIYPPVHTEEIQCYPDRKAHTVTLTFPLYGATQTQMSVEGRAFCDGNIVQHMPAWQGLVEADEEGMVTLTLPLGETVATWSEYEPAVYVLSYTLGDEECPDTGKVSFGVRDFRTEGNRLLVNDTPLFLRGKHDGMVFPQTGAAPTDVKSWLHVFEIAKSYGINHYRFHTCCPPDAAFTAADIMGIYLEPELPFWGTVTIEGDEDHNPVEQDYLYALGFKILDTFGNHPSFFALSMGNELWGHPERIGEIIHDYRERDDRHLYTQGSNNFQHYPLIVPEEDFYVGVRLSKTRLLRGSYGMCDAPLGHVQTDRPNTLCNYDDAIFPKSNDDLPQEQVREIEIQYGTGVKKVKVNSNSSELIPTVPIVAHEVGEYEVYPHFTEIPKYTGPLKPRNLEIFQERLDQKGMLDQAEDFFQNSGALMVACYKEELEALFRSRYISGFQILDLQDFQGQGTALVGILDAFLDNKGLVTPEEWRMFCADCVLLAEFPSYVYTAGETFHATVKLRNYNPYLPKQTKAEWMLIAEDGTILGEGAFSVDTQVGELQDAGEILCELPKTLTAPTSMHLVLSLQDTDTCNAYDFMIYPAIPAPTLTNTNQAFDVTCTLEETLAALRQGKRVLYMPSEQFQSIQGFYCTDFWCYPMFRDISISMHKPTAVGTMGLCIQNDHPALQAFPCETYTTPIWYDLVSHTDCAILDDFPKGYRPIVQMIDNFDRNHRLGILWEARVGQGSLLVCTSRLSEIMDRTETRWFAKSILQYMASAAFAPKQDITEAQLRQVFSPAEKESST